MRRSIIVDQHSGRAVADPKANPWDFHVGLGENPFWKPGEPLPISLDVAELDRPYGFHLV